MRFCELIKEDLAALAQLPESSPDLEAPQRRRSVQESHKSTWMLLVHYTSFTIGQACRVQEGGPSTAFVFTVAWPNVATLQLFWLSPLEKAVLDYRCMYLALCHTALGKLLEASQVHLIAGNKENKLCGKPA